MNNYPPQNRGPRPPRKNRQIRISPIRVVDENGEMLGILSVDEAIAMAEARSLDLVEIAPEAKPPVCKIMNYSKYLYNEEKKKREARKKQKATTIKEIKFRPRIATHDLETKMAHMEDLFHKYDKVRLTIEFRGRENQHKDIGRKLLEDLVARYDDMAAPDNGIQMLGNKLSVVFNSKIKEDDSDA